MGDVMEIGECHLTEMEELVIWPLKAGLVDGEDFTIPHMQTTLEYIGNRRCPLDLQ